MSHLLATILLFWTTIFGVVATGGDNPLFKITTKRDSDKLEVKIEKNRTVFSVHSPFGISEAVIKRTNEEWPDAAMLRLYLKGLEGFRASSDIVTLHAAVSGQGDKQQVRIWKDGKENSPLDKKSPYWMEIHRVGSDDNPGKIIPRKNGYFEIQLPKALFKGNPESIKINWIDFYRS